MSASFAPRVGDRVANRYKLTAPLRGEGPAQVWRAQDGGGEITLVVLDPACCDPEAWASFAQVVEVATAVQIPGLSLLQGVGEVAPAPPHCLAEAHVGRGFDRLRAEDGVVPWQRALALGEQVAAILEAVETTIGLAHRGLTASRCAVGERGQVKVLDYGLAELEPLGGRPDESGYRAPEQLSGPGDACSDVFSLALILFELITGVRPATKSAPRLRSMLPEVPQTVDDLFAAALAAEPERRVPDVSSLRTRLREVLGLGPAPVSPESPAQTPAIAAKLTTARSIWRLRQTRATGMRATPSSEPVAPTGVLAGLSPSLVQAATPSAPVAPVAAFTPAAPVGAFKASAAPAPVAAFTPVAAVTPSVAAFKASAAPAPVAAFTPVAAVTPSVAAFTPARAPVAPSVAACTPASAPVTPPASAPAAAPGRAFTPPAAAPMASFVPQAATGGARSVEAPVDRTVAIPRGEAPPSRSRAASLAPASVVVSGQDASKTEVLPPSARGAAALRALDRGNADASLRAERREILTDSSAGASGRADRTEIFADDQSSQSGRADRTEIFVDQRSAASGRAGDQSSQSGRADRTEIFVDQRSASSGRADRTEIFVDQRAASSGRADRTEIFVDDRIGSSGRIDRTEIFPNSSATPGERTEILPSAASFVDMSGPSAKLGRGPDLLLPTAAPPRPAQPAPVADPPRPARPPAPAAPEPAAAAKPSLKLVLIGVNLVLLVLVLLVLALR